MTLQKLKKTQISVLFENEASYEVKTWSKEAQGYKSNILLLLYQYTLIGVFFKNSIIEIWEIDPWRTNISINGTMVQAFTEIVGHFYNIWTKIRKYVMEFD